MKVFDIVQFFLSQKLKTAQCEKHHPQIFVFSLPTKLFIGRYQCLEEFICVARGRGIKSLLFT